MGGMME